MLTVVARPGGCGGEDGWRVEKGGGRKKERGRVEKRKGGGWKEGKGEGVEKQGGGGGSEKWGWVKWVKEVGGWHGCMEYGEWMRGKLGMMKLISG